MNLLAYAPDAAPPQPVRAEARPCAGCGEPIQPRQLYVVAGPHHVGCSPRRPDRILAYGARSC
jgi:hypothetical protein